MKKELQKEKIITEVLAAFAILSVILGSSYMERYYYGREFCWYWFSMVCCIFFCFGKKYKKISFTHENINSILCVEIIFLAMFIFWSIIGADTVLAG